MDLFSLKGRTAFVPGGYGAIGAAICRGLARAGARVVVAGRDARKAAALARSLGRGARGVALDVEDVAAIRATVAALPRVDLLVNCVGMQREQLLADVDEDTFDAIYRTNLRAAMFLAQAVAKRQKRGGKQLHLLSVRAQLGLRGRGYSAYCASKGALVMLVRQHASELGTHGICVNGVAPTVVRTPMATHWLANPKTRRWLTERIPLGRIAEPAGVAELVLYLASDADGHITGQAFTIDGGTLA